MNAMSILFGRSIGSPKILDQIPLAKTPKARETPKTAV